MGSRDYTANCTGGGETGTKTGTATVSIKTSCGGECDPGTGWPDLPSDQWTDDPDERQAGGDTRQQTAVRGTCTRTIYKKPRPSCTMGSGWPDVDDGWTADASEREPDGDTDTQRATGGTCTRTIYKKPPVSCSMGSGWPTVETGWTADPDEAKVGGDTDSQRAVGGTCTRTIYEAERGRCVYAPPTWPAPTVPEGHEEVTRNEARAEEREQTRSLVEGDAGRCDELSQKYWIRKKHCTFTPWASVGTGYVEVAADAAGAERINVTRRITGRGVAQGIACDEPLVDPVYRGRDLRWYYDYGLRNATPPGYGAHLAGMRVRVLPRHWNRGVGEDGMELALTGKPKL